MLFLKRGKAKAYFVFVTIFERRKIKCMHNLNKSFFTVVNYNINYTNILVDEI